MAPKAAHEAAKKKAAKQKKILMVLAVPMLGAAVYAYTTLSHMNSQPDAVSATPAAQTTPAGAIPTPSSSTGTTFSPGVAVPVDDSLSSFGGFGRKDPFFDDGPSAAAAASSANGNGKTSGGGSTSKQPTGPLTGAVISINGKKIALALGTAFGRAPGLSGVALFRLVKVTAKSAVVGVVGTHQQFTLHVRKPLTLQQTGGWKYTLILEPAASAAPMTAVQPKIADQTP